MNIQKKILIFFWSLSFVTAFAQGENDNWYFGNEAAVNFSASSTTALSGSQMIAHEASGTVSDVNGNLLFYTNSQTIWNRDHQLMQNGTGLQGNPSAEQLIIVKNPANINQYFVFITATLDYPVSTANRISYSIVDMSLGPIGLNGQPLGAVLSNFKNIPVTDNLGNIFYSEAITAIAGTIADTYWVLIPKGNSLYSYKVDSSGFSNGNPVISNLNFPVNLGTGKYYSIKASPKLNNPNFSNLVCISHWGDNSTGTGTIPKDINRVMSFNGVTGVINNSYSLNINSIMSYLPEFNQNGSVLFLGNYSIYAIDLVNSTTSNVNFLQVYTDSQATPYFSIQRNQHGNIYISKANSNFLGIINNPNTYGSGISVTMNSVNLGSGLNTLGLPQLVPTFSNSYHPCIESLVLTYENNNLFNYEIGNTITTKDQYIIGERYNITMKAGSTVHLLPGTQINARANYHAFIAPCENDTSRLLELKHNENQKDMVLNLDMEEKKALNNNQINIYPNPASAYINIDSGNEKLISWELFDISGKNILHGTASQINIQNLSKANYILKINTANQQITKKVTVK
jgi:hypothetical protein